MGMAHPNRLRDVWRLANDWAGLSTDIKTSPDMSSILAAEERGKGKRSVGRGALGGGRGRGRGDRADTKIERIFIEYRTSLWSK
jgi:hypothetical protein